jgi:hypothetical protein
MVMKESLVPFVDSTETLAPKTARGERLAATKTAKTGFSQWFLASGGWLFCGKRPSIARTPERDGLGSNRASASAKR